MPAVQWNRLHSLRRDDMTDDGGRTIDERDLRLDDHRFAPVADDESKVPYQRAAHLEVQLVDDFGSKPCRCRADLIGPRGNRCDLIASLAIGGGGTVEIGRTVAHAYSRAAKDGAGLVEHTALQCRGRLSMKRRGKERQQSESNCEGKAVTASGNAQQRALRGGTRESSSELRRRLDFARLNGYHVGYMPELRRKGNSRAESYEPRDPGSRSLRNTRAFHELCRRELTWNSAAELAPDSTSCSRPKSGPPLGAHLGHYGHAEERGRLCGSSALSDLCDGYCSVSSAWSARATSMSSRVSSTRASQRVVLSRAARRGR